MNLSRLLAARAEAGEPVRVGLIGAGKFGTMFLAQARLTVGMHVLGIADLNVDRARDNCRTAGWSDEQIAAAGLDQAAKSGSDPCGRRCDGVALPPRARCADRCDRRSSDRYPPLPRGDRQRQARDHGQRRSGCCRRPPARPARGTSGRGLQLGVGRPAGLDRRACRLGARVRFQSHLRGQGHALPPEIPPIDARTPCGTISTSAARPPSAAA